jgi:glycine/D-amino acid oxidase-like deaminating enzyme
MGCTTALNLARGGMKVVVVERRGLCMEASGVNAGTLSIQIKRAALVPYALRGRELWETTREWLGGEVGYRMLGGLTLAFTGQESAMLEERMAARRDAGAPIEMIGVGRAREIEPAISEQVAAASYCRLDGYANSNMIGRAYRAALLGAGVELREWKAMETIVREDGGFAVVAAGEHLRAKRLVLSGGAWLNDALAHFDLQLPLNCRVNQVAVTEPTKPILRTILGVATGLLTLKQSTVNGSLLIGGGWQGIGDSERGGVGIIPENLIGNLRLAHTAVPALAKMRMVRTWLGLEANVPDFMPLVGPLPGIAEAYMIGCVRGGFTIGPFMGRLLAQAMLGGETEMPLFDPGRVLSRPQTASALGDA